MRHDERQLAELDRLLGELPAENGPMDLYELDGFVAALLVCPDLIMPSEWLLVVWGEEIAPTFETLDVAQATIGAVMAHYNRVAAGLARNPAEYEAVLQTDGNSGEILWEPWISGFEIGMRLRPEVWEATLESADEEVRSIIPMILALHEIDIGSSGLDDEAIDELDEIAPDLIPGMVLALNTWAKTEAPDFADQDFVMPIPQLPKVGRNEPCPCGSGKKFKKCCGARTFH